MSLDAKNFDLLFVGSEWGWGGCVGWDLPPDYLVPRWVNLQIDNFNIVEHGPRLLEALHLMFWSPKTSN